MNNSSSLICNYTHYSSSFFYSFSPQKITQTLWDLGQHSQPSTCTWQVPPFLVASLLPSYVPPAPPPETSPRHPAGQRARVPGHRARALYALNSPGTPAAAECCNFLGKGHRKSIVLVPARLKIFDSAFRWIIWMGKSRYRFQVKNNFRSEL